MKCEFCECDIQDGRFCTITCARRFSSKFQPKMKPQGKCKTCNCKISTKLIYCKQCRKDGKHIDENIRLFCPNCNIPKNETNSYKNQYLCKKCNAENSLQRARKFKLLCLEYKGDKCENCGYNTYIGALEFHHKDPTQKDFAINQQRRGTLTDNIKSELDKCSLLCCNCHREEHGRLRLE